MNATTTSSNRKSADPTKGRRKTHRSHALSTAALGCILAASVQVEAFPAMVPSSSVRRSCESEFVPGARPAAAARFSRSFMTRGDGNSDRRLQTSLRYRNGNEGDCPERLEQHNDAAASISVTASTTPVRTGNSNPISSMWDAIITKKPQRRCARKGRSEREQFVLDDYLEFIDRRYNRLHEDEKKTTQTPEGNGGNGINTAWNWLKAGDALPNAEERRRQEDALEVLGLAELASAELLRKHHLPVPEEAVDSSVSNGSTAAVVIDATVVPEDKNELEMASPSGDRVASISAAVIASRLASCATALKRDYERKIATVAFATRAAFYSSIRSVKRGIEKIVPTTAALLAMAGGSKTLKVTTAVAMALMVVIRPLGHIVVNSTQS